MPSRKKCPVPLKTKAGKHGVAPIHLNVNIYLKRSILDVEICNSLVRG